MSEELLTPLSIAVKYVHGLHNALTDNQEVKDMVADIETLLRQQEELQSSRMNIEYLGEGYSCTKEEWDKFHEYLNSKK